MTNVVDAGRHGRRRREAARSEGSALRFAVRATAFSVLLLVAAALGAPPAQAAVRVATSLSEQGGYARIILNWPAGVPHHTETMTAGVLVIKFDKPFTVDADDFLRQMPNTVALARQDADNKTLRLALKFDYWMNVRVAENSLYVDLLAPTWTGAPPPLPADVLARMAAAADAKAKADAETKLAKDRGIVDPTAPLPGLTVRAARHEGMTRLVFDWNQPVLYSIAAQEGSATITFDRTAKVALAPIRVNPPPYLESISAMEREGRLSVFLKLKPGVTVTDFREDLGVVLDLKPEQTALTEVAEAETPTPTAETAKPDTHDESAAEAKAKPGDHAEAKPAVTDAAPDATKDHAPLPITPSTVAAATTPDSHEASHDATQPAPAPTDAAPDNATAEKSVAPLQVAAHYANGRTDLEFPWTQPTGASVFVRSDTLWIVFDRRVPLDVSALDPAVLKDLGKPLSVDLERGTALAIPLTNSRLLIGASEDGTAWRVSLADTLTSTGRPIALTRSWSATGEGTVTLDLAGARDILQVNDPMVRDTLLVATARGPAQSVQAPSSFVEFQALKTAQGVAIVRIADDLNVAAAPNAVIVSRHDGLTLSADNTDASASTVGGAPVSSPALTDFAAWRGNGNFIAARQAYLKNILAAPTDEKAAARVAFVRFLLGHRMAPEALTQLEMAADDEKKIENDPSFRALRGIGEVLAARNAQAVSDLSTNAFEMDPNAAVWRGLARAALGQMELAHKDFERAGPAIDALDPDLAQRARLDAAGVSLAVNDIDGARNYMSRLAPDLESNKLRARALMMEARLLTALDKPQEAALDYDKAIALNDLETTITSRFEKGVLLNREGKLSNDKLIEELNKLRMAWRGGDLERRILTKLAELQLTKGNVVEALGAMRIVTVNFRDNDAARALGARMPDIFADYFIGEGSKDLTAIQALAFYYNFQDLTPIGQKGDELIRHLAERLVSIDLLAQAEVLLRYQVEQRLYGSVAKAQVAARLAGVYLLDEKPKDALQIIRATAQNQLPEDLSRQRQLIEARALASMKQYDLSLDLLSEITGPQSDELRADIFWEAQRWDEAGQAAQTLAERKSAAVKPDKPLPADVRFEIMRAAIAYSLADDDESLAKLHTAFVARMADTPDASSFAVVSDPIERSGIAFRELATRIASVNMMERFVESLKADETPPAPAKAAEAASASPVAVN
ncbi:MAG: hypothetical protein K8R18_13780 [Parvibaculum sp.]|uniref:hypothetical protein n=1 Tax=Parvibaculum sp. TaxID=2024848 RepID=UPI0025FC9D11|nr:hypothetical protein [Parvibaculum sp.]MCE9650685.1 hypothetical protein [Parvibaculum sp.]